jgi:Zinc knuckle
VGGVRRLRPEAVLISLDRREGAALSYADALKALRKEIKPEELGCSIASIRKTRNGDALIELKRDSSSPVCLAEAINKAMGGGTRARGLVPVETITILDIEEGIEKEELVTALCSADGGLARESVNVRFLQAGKWGTQLAIVTLPAGAGARLLRNGRIKIGWTSCRIRKKTNTTRCYRCHDAGHMARECTGPDRSKMCRRCGQKEHKAADCTGEPRDLACSEGGTDAASEMETRTFPAHKENN